MTNRPNIADHAAPDQVWYKRAWSYPPFRTFVQGLVTDLLAALGLVLYAAVEQGTMDFRLLALSLLKTTLMTILSYVMKMVKPYVHS